MKYGTSISKIKQWNGIRGDVIRKGQKLYIYSSSPNNSKSKQEGTSRQIIYVVKWGDTLSEIAEYYNTTAKQIRRWNRLSSNKIRKGQKLKIWR